MRLAFLLRRLLALVSDGGANAVALHLDAKAPEEDVRRLREVLRSPSTAALSISSASSPPPPGPGRGRAVTTRGFNSTKAARRGLRQVDSSRERALGEVILLRRSRVTYMGISMVDVTLRGISALLASGGDWRHFINLSLEDYPTMPMDNVRRLLAGFSPLANFMELSLGRFGFTNVVIDPGLYIADSGELEEHGWRGRPTQFSVCKGSAWMILSRDFARYAAGGGALDMAPVNKHSTATIVVNGEEYDGFPRSLLLYFANYPRPAESYFQTLIAHSRYARTLVPFPMRYDYWPQCGSGGCQHPADLGMKHLAGMLEAAPLFARKFKADPSAFASSGDERSELTRWVDARLHRGGQGNATYLVAALAAADTWVFDPARDTEIASPVVPTSCHSSLAIVRDVERASYADGRSRGAKVVARDRNALVVPLAGQRV
eukprot:PRCOL_00004271-RA